MVKCAKCGTEMDSLLSKLRGIGASAKNPKICNRCESDAMKQKWPRKKAK